MTRRCIKLPGYRLGKDGNFVRAPRRQSVSAKIKQNKSNRVRLMKRTPMNGIECAFAGKVGGVADLKTNQAGKSWLTIKVAVGHGENDTQWVRVVVFGSLEEQLASTLRKGDSLYCEGQLRLDHWKSADGQDRFGLSVTDWKAEKVGANAIRRNQPTKPRGQPEGDHPISPVTGDWQAPTGRPAFDRQLDDEIPF